MKKGRFLWSAHRITKKQKAGKARNIKEKQLKNSRNTVSKPPVVLPSSPRDKLLFQEARSHNSFGLLSFCFDANLPQIKKKRENSTVPPAASPAILPLSQNSRTPPKKSADALRSVADHNAAHTLRSMGGHCFFAASLWSGGGTGDERRGTRDGSRLHSPAVLCQTSFSHTTPDSERSMSKKEVSVYA